MTDIMTDINSLLNSTEHCVTDTVINSLLIAALCDAVMEINSLLTAAPSAV